MNTLVQEADRLIKLGFSVIPVDENKRPVIAWDAYKNNRATPADRDFWNAFVRATGIAVIGGEVSGNLECIDLDVKYDINGSCEDFLMFLTKYNLMTQETPSGGYHVIYRTTGKPEGNKKIAGREPIFGEEAKKLYFIESRGEGGYFLVSPSPKYDLGRSDLADIPTITWEQRNEIWDVARSYNMLVEEKRIEHQSINADYDGWIKTPFDDYNDRVDMHQLLTSHGWTHAYDRGSKMFYKRPGSQNEQSGNWDTERKWFTCFSPNTQFEVQKAYRACYVFAELEHGGNYKEAVKDLISKGYGVKSEDKPTIKIVKDLSQVISNSDKDHADIKAYLLGELPGGLLTGNPELDEYFRFKKNLVIVNGHANVGKSTKMWFMAVITAFRHNWKWVINTTENKSRWIRMALYEMIAQKRVHRMTDHELEWAKAWVEEHFIIINGSDFDFTAYAFVDMCVDICAKDSDIAGIMMDPYNSLLIDDKIKYSNNKHEYDYHAVSYMRRMAYDCGKAFWLNTHTNTEAQKKMDPKTKLLVAPYAADSEGGSKFANRADDFITIHRQIYHPDFRHITEMYIRKIKEQQLGGKPSPHDNPIRTQYMDGTFVSNRGESPLIYKYGENQDHMPG